MDHDKTRREREEGRPRGRGGNGCNKDRGPYESDGVGTTLLPPGGVGRPGSRLRSPRREIWERVGGGPQGK